MELEKDNIAPYLSILMGVKCSQAEKCNTHNDIVNILREESKNEIRFFASKEEYVGDIARVIFTPYQLLKPPSWLKGHDAKDVEHHVFVSFEVNGYFGFYFSEKGKKDEIRDHFNKKYLPYVSPVPINHLNSNFINEDKIKMLWLTGIHGRNNFKADSKVLGGESVADTLDPLIDQSYMMSAVRTEVWSNVDTTIGINTFKSAIWRGPCKDWQSFENRVIQILDLLSSNANQVANPISIISYPIANCSDLDEPYDFSLIDYEFFPEDDGQHRKELLRKLQHDYSVQLMPTFVKSDILLYVFFNNEKVGDITLEPKINEYQVEFRIKS